MLKIDTKKLADLIETCVTETSGLCVKTGACIGVVRGRQIHLHAVAVDEDDDESLDVQEKFRCVSE